MKIANRIFVGLFKLNKPLIKRKIKKITNDNTIYLYSIIIGGIAGLIAILFNYGISYLENYLLYYFSGISLKHPQNEVTPYFNIATLNYPWLIIILPAIGAFIGNLFIYYFAPSISGNGTKVLIEDFHEQKNHINIKTSLIKMVATIFTLGSGGSAGKEGPMAMIGAGFGSTLARKLKLSDRDKRTLLLVGTAGGLGALFKAPFAGALTSIEILYKQDLETEALIPCILSSVTGYIVYSSLFGFNSLFSVTGLVFQSHRELLFYLILATLCIIFGYVFTRMNQFIKKNVFHQLLIEKLHFHPLLLPLIGGLIVGVVGFIFPSSIGSGLGYIQGLLLQNDTQLTSGNPSIIILFFISFALLKMFTTCCTLNSNGSGGFFAPSLAIGGLLGASVGSFAVFYLPEISHITPYIIVGMAAFFAGVAKAPIATLFMVCELTGGYGLLLPLLFVTIIVIIFNRADSIYQSQRNNKFESPAHLNDMSIDILKNTSVQEIYDLYSDIRTTFIIDDDTSAIILYDLSQATASHNFIVTDEFKRYTGTVSMRDLNNSLNHSLAYDLAIPMRTVRMNESLSSALNKLLLDEVDRIACINEKNEVIGILAYTQVLKFYKSKSQELHHKNR